MNTTRHLLSALTLCLALPALAQEPAPAPPPAADAPDREARLRDAEARLQEAAREVARLTRDLAPMTIEIAEDVMAGETRPRLGLSLGVEETETTNGTRERTGVTVLGVSPGSAAEAAGIRAGDVLVGFDGESLRDRSAADAVAAISSGLEGADVGDRFALRVERDGEVRDVDVTLTEASFAPAGFAMAMGRGPGRVRIIERERLGGLEEREIEMLRRHERGLMHAGPAGVDRFVFISSDSPWASMELVELTPRLGRYFDVDSGLLVVRAPQDPALGFEDGDVIREIGGRAPENVDHAMRILRSYATGERLEIAIVRDGRRRTLTIDVPETVGRLGDTVPRPPLPAPAAPVRRPPPAAR